MLSSHVKKVALIFTLLLLGIMSGCNDNDLEGNLGRRVKREDLDKLELTYNFSLKEDGQNTRLVIMVSLFMPSDRIFLQLPNRFLREERLYDRLEHMEVISDNAELREHERPDYKLLLGTKGQKVTVRYYLKATSPFGTVHRDSFSAPLIHADFFMFVGQMALILPASLSSNPKSFTIRLNWEMPIDFRVYNSYAAKTRHQIITTSGIDLWDSVFFGGSNIRERDLMINGKPVIVTFEGTWDKISDDKFVETVYRLIKTQRDAWKDNDFPYFLVNFLSMGEGCTGNQGHKYAGTAHKNSFRAFFPRDCALEPSMKQLISHELMHNWIGKKIKMGEERGHIDGKFFTEGLTDYFGRKFAYKAGVISQEEYFDTLNRVLWNYQVSKERQAPLKKLVEHMYKRPFTNQDLEQLPYQQGELLALQLNKKIKEKTNFEKSLDNVILDMLAQAEDEGGVKNFSADEVSDIVDRYVPNAFSDEFLKIKEGHAPLIPPSLERCSRPEPTNFLYFRGRHIPQEGKVYAYTKRGYCEQWLN